MSRNQSNVEQVFLGGSCHPTTWRKDIAIPYFQDKGVTFYNPQVDDWSPELIENEVRAKNNCQVLFFMLDDQTRAVASIIEVAYYISSNRKIVLVAKDLKPNSLNGSLLEEEFEALNRGRKFFIKLAKQQNNDLSISYDILKALKQTISIIECFGEKSKPKTNHLLMPSPFLIKTVYLKRFQQHQSKPLFSFTVPEDSNDEYSLSKIESLIRNKFVDSKNVEQQSAVEIRDQPYVTDRTENGDKKSIHLLIIPDDSMDLIVMIKASFLIGCKGYKSFILFLPEFSVEKVNAKFFSHKQKKLNEVAAKDFNRGRLFLKNLAIDSRIPVVETLDQAIEFLVKKID